MLNRQSVSRRMVILLSLGLALLLGSYNSASAQNPGNDGRINQNTPWVNSFGAVAVYCLDANAKAGGTYNGAGIAVLNASGYRLLFASDVAILQAQEALNRQFNGQTNNNGAAPMCINTNLAARGHAIVTEIVGVQKQADVISAKYNLGDAGHLVTPDLSTIQFSLDTFDHQLLDISNQEAAFLSRTIGLRNTTAGVQNNAQLLEQVNGLDAQFNAIMGPLDAAIKRGGIIGNGLNGTQTALRRTITFWRGTGVTANTQNVAGQQGNPAGLSDFEQALNALSALQTRVNSAAAGINNVTFGLQGVRNRLNAVRTNLAALRATLSTDFNAAPVNSGTLIGYLTEADNAVRKVDSLIKRPCAVPQEVPGLALLAREGVYSMYALAGNNFQLNTIPDAGGRTVLGRWNTCSQTP
jgi:hypothetical protein